MVDATNDRKLEGIGGWLLLVVLGLIVSPIRIALMLVQEHAPIFADGTWQVLTSPSSDVYHPLWGPLILLEVGGNLLGILLTLTTLVLLFKKSRYTPAMAIIWYLYALVFVVADFLLARQIPMIAEMPVDTESVREIARTVVAVVIWVPYFLVSKRVKATFTRAWPDREGGAGIGGSTISPGDGR